jgi:AcrR family transcriptional regulator
VANAERTVTQARADATTALLDAAERLLVDVGYAGITTRKLADEAGVNAGLVHYYFGSMEEVFLRVLERFTDRLVERQASMYEGEGRFIDKWRTAMRYLFEDRASGYQKILFELFAMSWNRPEIRARIMRIDERWEAVVTPAVAAGMRELGMDTRRFPVRAMACLVAAFNKGIMLDGLNGVDYGHAELLDLVDRFLVRLDRERRTKKGAR